MKKIFSILFCAILCLTTMIVPCMAAEYPSNLPTIESITDFPYPIDAYFIVYSGGDHYLYVFSDTEGYINSHNAEFSTRFYSETNDYMTFVLWDDNKTTYNYSFCYYRAVGSYWQNELGAPDIRDNANIGSINAVPLVYSSLDLLDYNGEVFFQGPPMEQAELYQIIQKVTAGEMVTTQTSLAKTITTIVLCGVGCLALLIGLALLVKVLRRYLPR